ncbi:hypothetical protein MPTK1_3g15840 [Marchantia polymorpha subsp. ruderalis]
MVGPKRVTRMSRGRGLAGLARLRHEFHRFREEVGCIRSLPRLDRRWPSLARLEIDSEASSEDGALWDSREPLSGVSAPATADVEAEGNENGAFNDVASEFPNNDVETSHDILETSQLCGCQWAGKGCTEVRHCPTHFDEGSAKCDNDPRTEKITSPIEEDNRHCDDLKINLLLPLRCTEQCLGDLDAVPTSVDIEPSEETREPVKTNQTCKVPGDSDEESKSEQFEESQYGNPESETTYNLKLPDCQVAAEDDSGTKSTLENIEEDGAHLTESSGERRSKHELCQQKLDGPDESKEDKDPRVLGRALSCLPLLTNLKFQIDGELQRSYNEPFSYGSTDDKTFNNIEEASLSSNDGSSPEPWISNACFEDEIVDYSFSYSGARIAATPCFTANPYHKFGKLFSVPHKHFESQNQESARLDIHNPDVLFSARSKDEDSYNQHVLFNSENYMCTPTVTVLPLMDERTQTSPDVGTKSLENGEFADNSRDVKTPETKVVGAQLSQSMSSEDCKRSLKLVGYVYEEIPTKVAAPIPDRLISCEKSTSPIRTSADDMPVEITQPSLIASSGNIQSMRPVVASERATVNDQRPGSSQTNAIHNTSSRDHEVYGNRVQHQSAGMSSLFALSGLESLSKLENYFNRDSGLATRMATRIRHALESLGERSQTIADWRTQPEPRTSSATGNQRTIDMRGLAAYRARTGTVPSSNVRNLRLTTGSDVEHPKVKIVGDWQGYKDGSEGSDALGLASRLIESSESEEPEDYLQKVIAALDSKRDLSARSELAPRKNNTRLHEYASPNSMVPKEQKEGVANISSSEPRNLDHEHHYAHGTLSQMQKPGCSIHTAVMPGDSNEVNDDTNEARDLINDGFDMPKNSSEERRSVKIYKGAPAQGVTRKPYQHQRAVDEAGTANPQAFSVKINGSMVEIEVGERPPSIVWTPRGQSDNEVIRTSTYQTQRQSTSDDAYHKCCGATTSYKQVVGSAEGRLGPIRFKDEGPTQPTETCHRIVRFRDSVAGGKVTKSVRFHSPASDSSKNSFYSPKKFYDRYDRTIKNLAKQAHELADNEVIEDAVAESQQSPRFVEKRAAESQQSQRLVQKRVQEEDTSQPILKSPRGASGLDSEGHYEEQQEGSQSTEDTDCRRRHSASAVARPPLDIHLRRGKRPSILKSPTRQATSSSDCTSSINYDEDEVPKSFERKEKVEAAAAGLANELRVLMRNRTPEFVRNEEQHQSDDSMASSKRGFRKTVHKPGPRTQSGHFRPQKQAPLSQECPQLLKKNPVYPPSMYQRNVSPITSDCDNRFERHFGRTDKADCSQQKSEGQKTSGRFRSSTQPHQRRRTPQSGISVLAAGEGIDRFVYREPRQESNCNITRAKQLVRDTIGDDFDYDRFRKDLGELATERKRVEWLGQKLMLLQPGPFKIRQKKDSKEESLDLHKDSNVRGTKVFNKEIGSSGNKRSRSAISPLRESGKKLLRSDSGKKTISVGATSSLATSREEVLDTTIQPKIHNLGRSNIFANNIKSKMRNSDTSISVRASHQMETGSKSCLKNPGMRKSCKLEKTRVKFSFPEDESDRPTGSQFFIRRKTLRPPGSTFKVSMPVSWFPTEVASSKGKKSDYLMRDSTLLEMSGIKNVALHALRKPNDVTIHASVGTKRGKEMASKQNLQGRQVVQNYLNEAKRGEGDSTMKSDFSSDFCKWVLTPSSDDIHNQRSSVLRAQLVRVGSKATKGKAFHLKTAERASEKQSWSERMKAFLVSCGALLTESNTSKHARHSERRTSVSGHNEELNTDPDETGTQKMCTSTHLKQKKDGSISLRVTNSVNAEDQEKNRGSKTRELAKNKGRFRPTDERPYCLENHWGSQEQVGRYDGRLKTSKEKTELGRKFVGQKKAHDLLLTMLNKVSGGKSKHYQKVKPRSLQDATRKQMRALDRLGGYSTNLASLKGKDRARLLNVKQGKEDSQRGPRKLGVVEVGEPRYSPMPCKFTRKDGPRASALAKLPKSTTGGKSEQDAVLNRGSWKPSPVGRDSDRGVHTLNKGMRYSVENWLNVSGGFEFLDTVCDGKEGLEMPDSCTTILKGAEIRSSSDRASLHSWSVQSAEVGVPKEFSSLTLIRERLQEMNKRAPQGTSGGDCTGLLSGHIHQPGHPVSSADREEMQTRTKIKIQGDIVKENRKNIEVQDKNNMSKTYDINLQRQELTGFLLEPADSSTDVVFEYREGTDGSRLETHNLEKRHEGATSVTGSEVVENLDPFKRKSPKMTSSWEGTKQSSPSAEDRITESEELELALLELVLKTVLRDDLVKNSKSVLAPLKDMSSSAAAHRSPQCVQVDRREEASVLEIVDELRQSPRNQQADLKQSPTTQQSSDSATSSGGAWSDSTFLAEKKSRSVSCVDDEDWPEYLGVDDEEEGKVEGDIENKLSRNSSMTSLPKACNDVSTVMLQSPASADVQPSSFPSHISSIDERETGQFPGLSSLAFASAPPQLKKTASCVDERSSTGVQTNDLSIAQALNPVYVVPFFCLPDGRPLFPPYSTYPIYPQPDSYPQFHSMQNPTPPQGLRSVATTTAAEEDLQATRDINSLEKVERHLFNPDIATKIVLDSRSSSSLSSDSPFPSPATPSTPISSPEHEARVASALARHRMSQNRQAASFSADNTDDAMDPKGDQTYRQTEQKLDAEEIAVSLQDPLTEKDEKESNLHTHMPGISNQNRSAELVPGSLSSTSTSTRKDVEIRPYVSYDYAGSAELADSYDGSGSSNFSVCSRLSDEGLEQMDRVSTGPVRRFPLTKTRTQSPGEIEASSPEPERQADGVRYPLEAHVKRFATRWPKVVKNHGIPFSEGEVEAGGLRSEGECGQADLSAAFAHRNFRYTHDVVRDDVSEPGEMSRIVSQQMKAKSKPVEKDSLIQSLSEGEIRAEMSEIAETRNTSTPTGSSPRKSSPDDTY